MNYCTKLPMERIPPVARIIAIGDIHGDWRALKSCLKLARVINRRDEWTGGATHVVLIGDIIDRGVRSGGGDEKSEEKILRFLVNLKGQASTAGAGGDVHIILGNHELMNVAGDFRYVTPLGMQDFGGDRAAAFAPGGRISLLLACHAVSILKIGHWIFSHAGITSTLSRRRNIGEVNHVVRQYLLGNTKVAPDMDMFWHRRYIHEDSCQLLKDSLDPWQATHMAIGHTVQDDGIQSRCGGRLWMTDVGLSDAFRQGLDGRIQILEILNDGQKVTVLKGYKSNQ